MEKTSIHRYEITKELGRSSTSIVYKGYDPENQRQVRIKQLIPSQSIKRDLIKINAFTEVSHSNIATVHSVEKFEDTYIIVSDYFDGKTLQELFNHEELIRSQILSILLQISKGLEGLHKNNLYHGNLKPSNIVITDENKVILVDAGLSPFEDFQNSPEFYAPYIAIHYLAPEQISNEPLSLQTDFFVVGILAYRMFFGKFPFDGDNEEKLLHSITNDEPDFSDFASDEQTRLIELLLGKLLTKQKGYRFSNSSELAATLQEILDFKEPVETDDSETEMISNPRKYLVVSAIVMGLMILWVFARYFISE